MSRNPVIGLWSVVIARHRPVWAVAGVLGMLLLASCDAKREPIHITGPAQGTSFTVTITQPPAQLDAGTVRQAMREVIDTVGEQVSTWDDNSELSRFNKANANSWVSVSSDLASLVQHALDMGRKTDGAFDVTVAPVLETWGFGARGRVPTRLPTRREVQAALENTGLGLVEVRQTPPALRKKKPEIRIALAGLAQGYTVDRMAARLDAMGAKQYLVELGGELFARGMKKESQPWRIGVEKPEAGVRKIDRVVKLSDAGMTTSGDYRDFFEIDGHRFSHTIDPRTGRPVAHDLRSVTVVADDAMTADAMATTLLVMGPQAGVRYATKHDIAALFVSGDKDGYTEDSTKAFEPYMGVQQ